MAMLNLDAFNTGNLRDTLTLLELAKKEEMTLEELITELEKVKMTPTSKAAQGVKCPSCDRDYMFPKKVGNETIQLCKSCRYSEIIDGE